MRILRWTLNLLGVGQLPDLWRDVSNYFYIRKRVQVASKTEEFQAANLSLSWFGTPYTVVNLPPDVFSAPEDVWKLYVMEKLIEYDAYFQEMGLTEIVTPRLDNLVDKKRGIYAYGIKFIQLKIVLGWGYLFRTAAVWASIWAIVHYLL